MLVVRVTASPQRCAKLPYACERQRVIALMLFRTPSLYT